MSSGKTNISNIPTEILVKILLYLDPKERLPFGYSCKKFKSIIFEDKEILRKLDFSKNAASISESVIRQYFNSKVACGHMLKVNARKVNCTNPPSLFYVYLAKAVNIVDMDVTQSEALMDIWSLGIFLSPKIHLKRLAIHWGITEDDAVLCRKVLEEPFSRLTHLSVKLKIRVLKSFLTSLESCQKLRNLYMCVTAKYDPEYRENYWESIRGPYEVLSSLEVFGITGREWSNDIITIMRTMLPEPEKWTDFRMGKRDSVDIEIVNRDDIDFDQMDYDYYLERNVEVCEELIGGEWMRRDPYGEGRNLNLGWILYPELLLQRVLIVIYEHPPGLCCLSKIMDGGRCLITIEDAKLLLKNPRYQFSYLYVTHDIEIHCDIHLAASAFPCLTELHLCNVSCNKKSAEENPQVQRAPLVIDFSFKLLIENTPHLKHLTLEANNFYWDPAFSWKKEECSVIPNWKNLESLRLIDHPISEWGFIIETGKQCKKLQKLEFNYCRSLEYSRVPRFNEQLLEMLLHCHDLKEFSISMIAYSKHMSYIGDVTKWFTRLAGNKRLRKLEVAAIENNVNTANLISSIENLLKSCPDLKTFRYETKQETAAHRDMLLAAFERLRREIKSPNIKVHFIR